MTGDYVIPRIIYSDAYSSEMVAYADLILPDTTYLERHDCISLLDRPICEADAAADAIRWPVIEPDRDVRGFQSVLCDLGARLNLPGFVNDDGSAKYADYADYITNHERRPGIGPLSGWRMGDKGLVHGRGGPNADQIDSYIENGGFWVSHIPEDAAYIQTLEHGLSGLGRQNRPVSTSPQPYLFQLYVEPMRKFQLAAEGHGIRQPPDHLRGQIKTTLDPLPIWYPPLLDGHADPAEYPIHALTQRPMAMYHSWGSAERLAAANPRAQPALCADQTVVETRLQGRRLGARHLGAWRDHRAGRADGRAERKHRLDLERHRQAQGRLGAGRGRARGHQGLPAEPPDRRACCRRAATACAGRIPTRSPVRPRGSTCASSWRKPAPRKRYNRCLASYALRCLNTRATCARKSGHDA